jgi:glutamate synthase domain-containing protein 2/glutamate synthase domain-containing protein 1/glutamate synthase domain-containing protein 3
MKGEPSHAIVDNALRMLENMTHRGACGCEVDSGDGAGIMVRTPHKFLRKKCAEIGIRLPTAGQYACGMIFLPRDMRSRLEAEHAFENVVREYGMVVLGWRDVPVNENVVGRSPFKSMPRIRQVFIAPGQTFFNRADFDRRLYFVRQRAENVIEFSPTLSPAAREDFYICILSANRMIYKGMLTSSQLREFYPDLQDPDFESALAMVHSRFSTNTFPSWRLAHPFRYLAHNGEINTLRGNRNWMRSRYASLRSEVFGDELPKMFPILTESGSDSATLDNALQFLAVNGRSLPHAVLMLIPEAWQNNPSMDPDLRAFYEYHACMMEPWDGPASISFTNGYMIGAVLDRNGLRPSRIYITKDDLVIMASEVGVLPVEPERVARKWRLQPGKVFLVDMKEGRIVDDNEIKQALVDKRPWRKWIDEHLVHLDKLPAGKPQEVDFASLRVRQHAFGYTVEELKMVLNPMAVTGIEGLGSMGNDTPLACLSEQPQLLYNYFKQLFAQVTNPPLDAIREELVTSLETYLGREGNLLEETPKHCRLVKLKQPILSSADLEKLRGIDRPGLKAVTLPMVFNVSDGHVSLESAVDALCEQAAAAVREGASILILSDRGVDRDHAPIPALLATSAVHHHLIREGTRNQAGLVIETGEAREAHHFCLLIGYGAGAVNPYLAFETLADLVRDGILPKEYGEGEHKKEFTLAIAEKNYIKAANKAILKVASKMGISTVQSYRGAQIFEAVGLGRDFVEKYFTHTPSRIGGIGINVVASETLARHRRAFPPIKASGEVLENGGFYQWRRDGEYHMYNPDTVARLQHAVRYDLMAWQQVAAGEPGAAYRKFKDYTALLDDEAAHRATIRGLLKLKGGKSIPLSEVEPANEIVKRFVTGAMSFGSISREAHETLAIAMNRLGGKSNTGEGGEDPERFQPDRDAKGNVVMTPEGKPRLRRSAIKQVASGRFGVTTEYLVNSDEMQIKMAQGAKPGEGGQLPGHKVDAYVGKIRHSTPGVGLISPPPHHDIYSIEDLAQLIHDLKNVNPKARVSVKLVAEVGVGTVAAGVAKAKADHILVSGDSGGTGASPLTSIKYAGLPWELGISEAHQVLVLNDLRSRVVLQTDGQIKTGKDCMIAFMLGAEEIGISTAALISAGCIMMRVCHLNTCPVGVATQDPELRKRFSGQPEHVINFFYFLAQEIREHMAALGVRKIDDLIGQTQYLEFDDVASHPKAQSIDLSAILYKPSVAAGVGVRCTMKQDHGLEAALDNKLIELAQPAIAKGAKVRAELQIQNTNRTVGAMLSGRLVEKHGFAGLPDDTVHLKFTGSAGQSFGAWAARGVTLELEGDANDYVGKGLSGGRIVIYPPRQSTFKAEENILAGNVLCYGAIAGEVYIRGIVGERFCVRNSGVSAVVEGVGDHGCEYMTGGRVVVLGGVGRNFAAGMSGGIAYVLDEKKYFKNLYNAELVDLEALQPADVETIQTLLKNHLAYTGSTVAKRVLDNWAEESKHFVKVMPRDYRKVLERQAEMEAKAAQLSQRQVASV